MRLKKNRCFVWWTVTPLTWLRINDKSHDLERLCETRTPFLYVCAWLEWFRFVAVALVGVMRVDMQILRAMRVAKCCQALN